MAQLKRSHKLLQENKRLKERVVILEILDKEKNKIIETLKLQMEELQRIFFGKSKKSKKEESDKDENDKPEKSEGILNKIKRTTDSYRRKTPKETDMTDKKESRINTCPDCKTQLSKKETKKFYTEDIEIPKKVVIEHTVEKGFCKKCKKWHSGIPLPTTNVIIGENVRNYVAYSSVILRLSYSQIVADLKNRFNFTISGGEINGILKKKAEEHRIDYEKLKKVIQSEKVLHFDETGDRIRDGDGYRAYTWLMQGAYRPEVLFQMGQTRGKGVAEKMLEKSRAVGVTDDYNAYKNLFKDHQLCWAHVHRKLKDLAESNTLGEESLKLCKKTFAEESIIYSKVRKLANRSDLSERQRKLCVTKLSYELANLSKPNQCDPKKLATYKHTLSKNIPKYLTCVRLPDVPCDNNQAERTLRHVVLKRKISFGHISARGAETMSILMSIFLTIKNRIKDTDQTFFEAYERFVV